MPRFCGYALREGVCDDAPMFPIEARRNIRAKDGREIEDSPSKRTSRSAYPQKRVLGVSQMEVWWEVVHRRVGMLVC